MSEWKEYNLGDAPLEIIDGDRGKNYPSQSEFSEKGYCLFLSTKNVRYDGFDFTNCQFVSKEKDNKLRKGKLKRFDLVLTTRGTIGNLGFYDKSVEYEHIRINSGMVIIRPTENLDPIFNYYTFRKLQNNFNSFVSGSAQPQLPIRDLNKLIINLPPLPEQKRIAEILSSLDDKIELNNKMNKNLEEMAQAIFKQWFVDFEFPDENGNPYKSSGGKMIQSELGDIPAGWCVKELGEICQVITGKTPSTKISENYGAKYPFITIPDMHNQVFTIKTERYLSETGNIAQRNKLIPAYSIQVSCIATIGLVTINIKPSHTNQQINSMILKNDYELYYFYEYSKLMTEKLKGIGSTGSTTFNVNKSQFEKIKYIYPEKKNLVFLNEIIKEFYNKILENQLETDKLTKTRDLLLPRLMSGEIRE